MSTKTRIYQRDGDEYVRLNTLSSWDTDFKENSEGGFTSNDPRLISSAHSGQRLILDSIPLNGKVQVWDTQKTVGFQAKSYDSFNQIHGGQNTYYFNKKLAIPFIDELFVQPCLVVKENYIDPMSSYKPHYHWNSCMKPKSCLTWIRDSQFHREDMMSKQIWKRNQTNYEVNLESQ
jgi:hypothetical protein